MKNSKAVAGVFLTTLLISTGAAHAAETKIVNQSGLPIDELSVAAPGSNKWGPNLLEGAKEGALDSGKSLTVKEIADGVYDFQLSAPDEGIMCVMKKVHVKKGVATLDTKMGKACK